MSFDMQNQVFMKERLEKRTICKMITMGLDPLHQTFLNEKATAIVDDFMKAGATAKALVDLAREIDALVVGVGVVVATSEPEKKICESYESLLTLEKIDEETGEIYVKPTSYRERSKGKKG